MITVKGLTKRYAHNTAVNDISFEVQKGQIVGFLGPNGAGKTTTMRMLATLITPTSGSATVAGCDLSKDPVEMHDLAKDHPEVVARLEGEFQKWKADVYSDCPYNLDEFMSRLKKAGIVKN